ncbi:MAG TPA: sulfite exporter TauE/SafE family protein [Gemmatimonadales bacterium]|nr:sulfite exporter TauE/SafE family protein [Gemmatimonadales bacterium]
MNQQLLSLFVIGLAAGGFGALLGVGGGLIIVPALSLLAGLSLHASIGTSLVCICASSAGSAAIFLRNGRVDLPVAIELQLFSVLGAVVAGLTTGFIPATPLYFIFAVFLALVAVQMWPRASVGFLERWLARVSARQQVARAASVGAGLLSGLLGVGGGILNAPVLHFVVGMRFDRATATSSYMIGMTAAAGALVYLVRGDIQPGLVTAAMVGTLVGSVPAALAGHRLSARWLRIAFAILLLFVAYQMIRRGAAEL